MKDGVFLFLFFLLFFEKTSLFNLIFTLCAFMRFAVFPACMSV